MAIRSYVTPIYLTIIHITLEKIASLIYDTYQIL